MSKTKLVLVALLLPTLAIGAELQHIFSSPSFSGIGYSSHVLTIHQLETQARDKNKAAADAMKAKEESDKLNTPQAKFQANLESRIYSQLAKQITDSLFGSNGAPQCVPTNGVCGDMEVAGNNITWRISGSNIIVRIENVLDPRQYTEMIVPSGTFGF
jgi:Type VIII secretion system (T8SS), CsgF protein